MKKPISLRAHLEAWLPDLKRNPDKLHVFVEAGHVATKAGASTSFEYRYTLILLIEDFAERIDTLVVPILVWAQEHQPDLIHTINKQDEAITIRAEHLDHDKMDVELTLKLSERVLVRQVAAGYECEHIGEPPLPDLGGHTGWQLYVKGVLIAPAE